MVTEILQSIRQSDMSPILSRIHSAPGGTEALDVLMKYMYVLRLVACHESPPHGHPACTYVANDCDCPATKAWPMQRKRAIHATLLPRLQAFHKSTRAAEVRVVARQ